MDHHPGADWITIRALTTLATLYALDGGEYVSYILGAPEFVNEDFRALFADGVPSVTPLVVKRDGP